MKITIKKEKTKLVFTSKWIVYKKEQLQNEIGSRIWNDRDDYKIRGD